MPDFPCAAYIWMESYQAHFLNEQVVYDLVMIEDRDERLRALKKFTGVDYEKQPESEVTE